MTQGPHRPGCPQIYPCSMLWRNMFEVLEMTREHQHKTGTFVDNLSKETGPLNWERVQCERTLSSKHWNNVLQQLLTFSTLNCTSHHRQRCCTSTGASCRLNKKCRCHSEFAACLETTFLTFQLAHQSKQICQCFC